MISMFNQRVEFLMACKEFLHEHIISHHIPTVTSENIKTPYPEMHCPV